MATCTVKRIEETRYVLELTKDEAQALRDVLEHVGGHREFSRRGLCDLVLDALKGAGFREHFGRDIILAGGGIHFE